MAVEAVYLIECKYRILVAGFACLVWSATIALGQTTDGESQVVSQLPLSGEPLLNQSAIIEEASIASSQSAVWEVASSLPRDDGITVSMLNGKSRLRIFGSLSALSVYSTDRPFAPGMPLFLLPESPFGLDTNTFDIHGRQSNIGATFIGPEANGFTPSGTKAMSVAIDKAR